MQIPHFPLLDAEYGIGVFGKVIESGASPNLLVINEGFEGSGDPPSPGKECRVTEGKYFEPNFGRDKGPNGLDLGDYPTTCGG